MYKSSVASYPHFSLVAQSCLTLCDPMDCSMPALPVHHQLPEFTQTHVHWVSDAIQPSHPLLSPSPTFNLSSVSFSNDSVLRIRWPKFWSFSFSISPSSAYSDTQNYSLLLARTLLWNSSPSLVAFKNGRAGFTKGQTSVQISVLLGNIWQQTFLSLFWSLIPVGREVLPKLEISALWKGRHNWDTEECTGKRKAQSNAPCSWLLVSNAMKGKRSGTKKNSSGTCVAVGRKLFLFTSCLSSLRMQVFILLFNSHGDPKGQKFLSQSRRGLESLKLSS